MTAPRGLLLSDDLIFTSRVTATAGPTGRRGPGAAAAALLALAREGTPAGVIVDLHNPGLDLDGFLVGLRAACPGMPRVIAYGSHVDAARLKAARAGGM